MAKYLLMGDIHLSDRPPSSCTERYNDQIFEILDATVALARDLAGLEAVVWAGDVFHHKTPGRTSHRTVRRAIDLAAQYPAPLYVVPGNHDLSHDRLASIDEGQPLGTLFASGHAQPLSGWLDADRQVYGIPWLGRFTDDTVGDAFERDWHRILLNTHTGPPALVVTHAPLYPPGLELPFEHYPTSAWADAMHNHGSVYYGHIHEAHGIYTVGGVTFCNPGAISRGSLHEHNLTRTPSCAVWDSDTGLFEIIPLPADPADQVFRLADAEQARDEKLRLDTFLNAVKHTQVAITSTESVIEHVRGRGLTPDLEAAVIALLQEAS